jgi:hypothetical protein
MSSRPPPRLDNCAPEFRLATFMGRAYGFASDRRWKETFTLPAMTVRERSPLADTSFTPRPGGPAVGFWERCLYMSVSRQVERAW